jgi:glycosyltransferase involved in cell wall biosynthesis
MSDGPNSPTGLGNSTLNIMNGLKKEFGPENIAILDWQYVGQKRTDYDGVSVYPINNHLYGKDTLYLALQDFKPNILITVGDYWMMDYLAQEDYQKILKKINIKWIAYITVDSDSVPIFFRGMFKSIDKVISPSKYGRFIIERDTGVKCDYIPFGFNSEIYKQVTEKEKDELKKKQGFGGKFVIGCVARNQDRKQLPRLVEAFSIFAKDKIDAVLYLHCDVNDPVNIIKNYSDTRVFSLLNSAFMTFLNNEQNEKVFLPPFEYNYISGFKLNKMNEIYNMFDIHALSTTGEGFGLPIIESMACGIPNVITDFTTTKELLGETGDMRGYRVSVSDYIFAGYGSKRAIVSINDMAVGFNYFYEMWKRNPLEFKVYQDNCIRFTKDYDWGIVIKKWVSLISEMRDL